MQLYTVHVDQVKWGKPCSSSTRIVTKCVEVPASDILEASEKAIKKAGGGYVSMIWPKVIWKNVNGVPRLFACFEDGTDKQLGKY